MSLRPLLACVVLLLGWARAADRDLIEAPPGPRWPTLEVELGLRLVAGVGTSNYELLDTRGIKPVSTLSFRGLGARSAEVSARLTHGTGFFAHGRVGLGSIGSGTLQDEDYAWPPYVYSSTDSLQRGGSLDLVQLDLGYLVHRSQRGRVGLFIGYRRANESVNAYGCTQTASSPGCVPSISTSVKGITVDSTWSSPRLGVDGELSFLEDMSVAAELALLPFLGLAGRDTHWLRIGPSASVADFYGPTPFDGQGIGYQVELVVRRRVWAQLTIGLGGRYSWLDAPTGTMHFEESAYQPANAYHFRSQPTTFHSERLSGFLQLDWRT